MLTWPIDFSSRFTFLFRDTVLPSIRCATLLNTNMRKSTAVRVLHLISLLPPALAAIVCYDISSPMHPEILTPVDCWSDFAVKSKNSSMDEPGKKHRNPGGGSNPANGSSIWTTNERSSSLSSGSQHINLPFFNFAPDAPLSEVFNAPALPPPTWNADNKIKFQLDCRQSGSVCDAMNQTLYLAGWYVSQVMLSLSIRS